MADRTIYRSKPSPREAASSRQIQSKLSLDKAVLLIREALRPSPTLPSLDFGLNTLYEVAAAAKTASAVGASDLESRETIHRERSRYIPSAARERTLERASYRCEYRTPGGTRCRERTSLEIDHVQPFGKGGGSEESNLRVLCRGHNRLLAERTYGVDVIERRIKESTEAREARTRLERVSQAGC